MRVLQGFVALVVFLSYASVADASEHRIRGKILDAAGKGVPDIGVANAWTHADGRVTPLEGVTTDRDGRFSLSRKVGTAGLRLLAFNEDGTKGALLDVTRAMLAKEVSATLQTCVAVKGSLRIAGSDYYPSGAIVWMGPPGRGAPTLRVEPDKGSYHFKLPPGTYEWVAMGKRITPQRYTVELKATEPELDVGRHELSEFEGRVKPGELAPPIQFKEASDSITKSLRRHHYPKRLTLCYFWASR